MFSAATGQSAPRSHSRKTLLARSFAQLCALDFTRIEFTPDLIPSDITGASVYDRSSGSFRFERGPIFTNILLADEINRAPGKTQAALLEGMEERQVTLENMTRQLEPLFLVLARQNPIEYKGTYPLPEAQLDRFLVRIAIGYPSEDAERDILLERSRAGATMALVAAAVPARHGLAMGLLGAAAAAALFLLVAAVARRGGET